MLMMEDLPTLERPITATSGRPSWGHCDTSALLLMNSADLTLNLRELGQEAPGDLVQWHVSCKPTAPALCVCFPSFLKQFCTLSMALQVMVSQGASTGRGSKTDAEDVPPACAN